jgi:hypothetical protein
MARVEKVLKPSAHCAVHVRISKRASGVYRIINAVNLSNNDAAHSHKLRQTMRIYLNFYGDAGMKFLNRAAFAEFFKACPLSQFFF